jgi:hypothetical protein
MKFQHPRANKVSKDSAPVAIEYSGKINKDTALPKASYSEGGFEGNYLGYTKRLSNC